MARDDLLNGWLAIANGTAMLQEMARLAAAGDLHVTMITPPGSAEYGELTITVKSSSPTAYAEIAAALTKRGG